MSKAKLHFSQLALAYLTGRGVPPAKASRYGIAEIDATETHRLTEGRHAVPSLKIPYNGLDGRPTNFWRVRLLKPQASFAVKKGKQPKDQRYDQPCSSGVHAYFPLNVEWPRIQNDTNAPLLITEGEIKALRAGEHGISCIGLGGVWSFKSKKAGLQFLPELESIAWPNREVVIVFDSDINDKREVRQAQLQLANQLAQRGAKVSVVRLPAGKDGAKVGLDDYLERYGKEKFLTLPRENVITAGALILDHGDPTASARAFLTSRTNPNGNAALYCFSGDFYERRDTHYEQVDEDILRAQAYKFLESAQVRIKDGFEPFKPTTHRVNDVLDALRSLTELHTATGLAPDELRALPFWLKKDTKRAAADRLLPCENGLLDPATCKLLPHTPEFFNVSALPFSYNPRAPRPTHWLRFLAELWPGDPESIATLQEIFGYLLTSETKQQKIFLIVGPKRGGKGTIVRLLHALLGQRNVVAPTLDSLTRNFGLAPLIGKSLAAVSDARLGDRADQKVIAERFLSVSGEDAQTIDRKHRSAWTGRLSIRFLLTTNEIPRIADASGALASRFIVLRLTKSFYGQEDLGLDDKLRAELPGILNWALEGLARLRKRGHFVQPKKAQEAVELLQDLTSPMSAFLRERCVVNVKSYVGADLLFQEWRRWCAKTGREHPGTRESFGRDLHAAVPGLQRKQRRVDGKKINVYEGVGLAQGGVPSCHR